MAYPEAQRRRRRAGEPGPARGRAARARPLGRRQDLRGQSSSSAPAGERRQQRVRLLRRPAVRQRPAALRPPAHRVRQGRRAALPDDARPPGRAPVRLGLPRPARRGGGGEAARHHHQGARSSSWASTSSTTPAGRRCSRYTKDWERYVTRQARWVDFANDYKTLDLDYMESVMWAFKTLYDKGLVYEGFRVLAYCWRCETPLSNTETRMDDVYRDRQDPALTVWFQLATTGDASEQIARLDHHAVDAAVQPGARGRPGHRVRGAARRDGQRLHPRRGPAGRVREGAGGLRPGRHGARAATWSGGGTRRCSTSSSSRPARTPSRCSAADFVTTEDGTGVVHLAPAFGEDDQIVCNAAGIPTVVTVDDHTRFTALVPAVPGHAGLRGEQAGHPRAARSAAWCCATTATPTRTRTAGAATRRWSTRRCRRGSWR